jgi:hypothetical protein
LSLDIDEDRRVIDENIDRPKKLEWFGPAIRSVSFSSETSILNAMALPPLE